MAAEEGGLACISQPLVGIVARPWPALGGGDVLACLPAVDSISNTLNGHLVAIVVCDSLTPLAKLLGGPFKLVVIMTEYAVGSAGRIRESRAGGKATKVLVEAVVWRGEEQNARAILAEHCWSELVQSGCVEMLNADQGQSGSAITSRSETIRSELTLRLLQRHPLA